MKKFQPFTLTLQHFVNGGQVIGETPDGKKVFAWGGLPQETVEITPTKVKSKFIEGQVSAVIDASPDRVTPLDPDSYLSTSPWQILVFDREQTIKAQLIDDAFRQHHVTLPAVTEVIAKGSADHYRNKIEFSFWWDKQTEQLSLAFYRRGSHSKIAVAGTSLAMPEINDTAARLIQVLNARQANGFDLKTVIIRADQTGRCLVQLYVKTKDFEHFSESEIKALAVEGCEIIYSNPQSPASIITERLQAHGARSLSDTLRGITFHYSAESFFQINLPVYEAALETIAQQLLPGIPVVDFYSGVGTIGLTVAPNNATLVEINPHAVDQMKQNIVGRRLNARAICAPSEQALDYITSDQQVIVDPPRAGLHADVVATLLDKLPPQIIYLSCNPVTQARDVALLSETGQYQISYNQGYNFFPRTPHIENLVVLKRI